MDAKPIQSEMTNKQSEEIVVWRKNFFALSQNLDEPRGPSYKCYECNQFFHTRLSRLTHSHMHQKPFCMLCGVYTKYKHEMYVHMKIFHRHFVNIKGENAETIIPEKSKLFVGTKIIAKKYMQQDVVKPFQDQTNTAPRKSRGRPRKYTVNAVDLHETKVVTSRFGRSINYKVPEY